MESEVGFACAIGNALVKDKDLKELLELLVALQLILSIVNGAIVGAEDTALTVTGDAFVAQGIEGIKSLVIDSSGCITTSSIEMVEGGTIKITGSA